MQKSQNKQPDLESPLTKKDTVSQFPEDRLDMEQLNPLESARIESVNDTNRKNAKIVMLLNLCIAVLLAIIIYVGFNLGRYYYDLWREGRTQAAVELIMSDVYPVIDIEPLITLTPAETGIVMEVPPSETSDAEPVILPEIQALREKFGNNDIVGYISIEGTNIRYAVAQGDDNEFYLDHDISGEKNAAGSVFMDYQNSPDAANYNTVLYGHNMKNGSMFHDMRYYKDKAYRDARPLITLKTLYYDTEWEIFSFYITDTSFNYIETSFENEQVFLNMANILISKSAYQTRVTVGEGDRILTLSTCTNTTDDTRYVLHARLKQ